jgi:hypothetical protein
MDYTKEIEKLTVALHEARVALMALIGNRYLDNQRVQLREWKRKMRQAKCDHHPPNTAVSKSSGHCLRCMRDVYDKASFEQKWGVFWTKEELLFGRAPPL